MSDCKTTDSSLLRSGTNQFQRNLEQLKPANLELQDFDVADWILFAYNFAKHLNYFDTNNPDNPNGNWQDFFAVFQIHQAVPFPVRGTKAYQKLKNKVADILFQFEKEGNLTPHLNLFVSFLELLEYSNENFNALSKRHLDFYYYDILQVNKREYQPDQVHVLFELAKKSTEQLIAKGTYLKAGKDSLGKTLLYKTKEDLVVNHAKIASIKSIYNEKNSKVLKASFDSKTLDGLKEALPKDKPYWYPFGYYSESADYIELPNATLGFALSSPIFNLNEGERNIEVQIEFNRTPKESITFKELAEFLTIEIGGEKNKIENIKLKEYINLKKQIKLKKHIYTDKNTFYNTSITGSNLKLAFSLDKTMPSITGYQQETFKVDYQTSYPVVRFLIDFKKSKAYDFFEMFSKISIKNITIRVDVKGVKSLDLSNDIGKINVKKPFHPFTTKPTKGSNFFIDSQEIFIKNLESTDVHLNWKATPEDLTENYKAYIKDSAVESVRSSATKSAASKFYIESNRIVNNDQYFTAKEFILHNNDWSKLKSELPLFNKTTSGYKTTFSVSNSKIGKSGPLKLSLNQDFLHDKFTRLYTLALIDQKNKFQIPNEAYTPLIEEISIDYQAKEIIDSANRIQLFHEHPFGQSKENIKGTLLPKYDKSSIFIGLQEVKALQNISLLIQVLEGSENPDKVVSDSDLLKWSVLCDNQWRSLDNNIISDATDNFLKSGLIELSLPQEVTDNNTLLPKGFVWIKTDIKKDYDAVCKFIDIHTQGVLAEFENKDNNLSHLATGLKNGTISKLATRIPKIKSVTQAYNSFNGIGQESDTHFYRRISERLRHKNRAITLWDYEHLILQEFPEVHRVKCLNHTDDTNFQVAGEVRIIVIPNTYNKNSFDVYRPKHSKATLNKITSYINRLNSLFVKAKVSNPNYEEVKLQLSVQFNEGLDFNFYTIKMNEDITRFLSPWAFESGKEIDFGKSLNTSTLIDFLDELSYVDYIEALVVKKNNEDAGNVIKPSNPKSILVSSKTHIINKIEKNCKI